MKLIKIPFFIRKLTVSSVVWDIPSTEKIIYLTFDDGPIPEVTPKVLELLERYDAKATFFCVGENIERNHDIYESLKQKGHQIGNHTLNHNQAHKVSTFQYFRSILKSHTLHPTKLFRPPHGKLRIRQFLQLRRKYKLILWTVMSYDFDKTLSPKQCLHSVVKNTQSGSIVVFHDSIKASRNMFYALEGSLRFFTKKGYRFEALPV